MTEKLRASLILRLAAAEYTDKRDMLQDVDLENAALDALEDAALRYARACGWAQARCDIRPEERAPRTFRTHIGEGTAAHCLCQPCKTARGT